MASRRSNRAVTVVGCGKAKIWDKHPKLGKVQAKDAYIGSLFKLSRRFAEKYSAGNWLIFSARYGLIEPSKPISDYDVMIGSRSTVNSDRIRAQWRRLGAGVRKVVCLASKPYVGLLRESLPLNTAVEIPLDHLDLFKRTQWLKRHS